MWVKLPGGPLTSRRGGNVTYDVSEVAAVSNDAPRDLRRSDGPGVVASVWRYRGAVLATTVVSAVIGFLVSVLLLPTTYEATSTVVVSDIDAFYQDPPDPERRVSQERSRLTSRSVFGQAARELRPSLDVRELEDTVDIAADPLTGEIEVTATAESPPRAAAIADGIVSAYQQRNREAAQQRLQNAQKVIERQSRRLRERIDEINAQTGNGVASSDQTQQLEILQSQLGELDARISELAADVGFYGSGIKEIEQAVVPEAPAGPHPVRNAALAGFLGLSVASALAYWRAGYLDSLKLDLMQVLDAPLLAEIPEFRRHTDDWVDPLFDIEAAEAYQFLLASFEYTVARNAVRSVLVTSASQGDGKSTTSLQLARALAVQDRDVCLVDSDIRARGLSAMLHADGPGGLVALAEGATLDSVVRRYRIAEHVRLSFVPAGETPMQPTGLLGTSRYREALSTIIRENELTIIDSGPLLTVADASVIAALVSGIILIVDADVSPDDVARLRDRLRLIPTPVLGIVVNRAPDSRAPYPYWSAPSRASRLSWRRAGRREPPTASVPSSPLR